jgi:hypothetical protein
MPDPEVENLTNWDHAVGVSTFQTPRVDALLFVAASTRPGHPIVADLSGESAPVIATDRDRAVLRAFLTLALQRLDTQESTDHAHP